VSDLSSLIARASRDVAPLFPLDEAVAVNPLLDAVDEPFAVALSRWGVRYGVAPWPRSAHLDEARRRGGSVETPPPAPPASPRPGTALERSGLPSAALGRRLVGSALLEALSYATERSVTERLREVLTRRGGWAGVPRRLREKVAEQLENSLLDLAVELGAEGEGPLVEEFARHFARLPGWAGWAKWNDAHPEREHPHGVSLVEFLRISLASDLALLEGHSSPLPTPVSGVPGVPAGLRTLEDALHTDFVERVGTGELSHSGDPVLQVICCIDPRSEPLRRAFERDDRIETFGTAGFFGLPVSVTPPGLGYQYAGLPALLQPSARLVSPATLDPATRATRLTLDALGDLTHEPESMFALAEVSGWASGLVTVLGVSRPDLVGRRRRLAPWRVESTSRVDLAEGALRLMGLTRFAPHVLVLGHAGLSVANAHYASLECGACGAHPGGPNAAGLAELLNDPEVRAGLSTRGLRIPSTTRFYSGEHLTTLAEVEVSSDTPDEVRTMLDAAVHLLRVEHAARLGVPPERAARDLRRRAHDWSEVRPEWGLAGHVGLLIGPRRHHRGTPLDGRAFLHSYEPDEDPSGEILAAIFSGPLVVAQWINAAYYFSCVAPDVLGAGDKTRLNPVSDFGVLSGDDPDLRLGLPLQSVERDDGPEHLPVRLLVAVDCPADHVRRALDLAPHARLLVEGEWVRLITRASPADPWNDLSLGE
jgi:uncharacterized protein YbcC (UPF0753/DUF2309 family)